MYSKEESKQVREQFWIFFGKRYPRKWILYDTKVKEMNLKFSFNNHEALVSIDIETLDETIREYYFERFTSLKKLMQTEISEDLIFEENYVRTSGKVISRIYLKLAQVNIHNKNQWPEVFEFFHTNMEKIEIFWIEYQDFITA
ncbi:DUF4268 domain-containing protein [Leeuwenhoekiella sp. A16]|uniref:DUF4268 domain-containing protein n=1 Tax=unclassified Leeuwenhoekiella TaxID=2615029 RepID=UPI003A800116